jgi:transposase
MVDAAVGRVKCPARRSFIMPRKSYSKAFKEEACKLVMDQKQPIATAAKGLGINEQTLRYWLVQRGWAPEVSSLPEELAESQDPRWLNARIRDLEQKLARAEMEREILKKATAYFASQPQ